MKSSLRNELVKEAPSDEDLLSQVRSGECSAMAILYDRYSRVVYSVALRVLKNTSSADDVTQELFLQLWRKPEQVLVLNETLVGWMVIAARNRAVSLLRKKQPDSLEDVFVVVPFVGEIESQNRLICHKALTLIRPDQRILLEMAFFNDLSHSEIAAATGEPLGTIKTRLRKAIRSLRAALIEEESPLHR